MSGTPTNEFAHIPKLRVEKYRLGQITASSELSPEQFGLAADLSPAAITSVVVSDPYVAEADANDVSEVQDFEAVMDDFARERRKLGYWRCEPATAYIDADGNSAIKATDEWGDPEALRLFLDRLGSPVAREWQRLVPSARALTYFYDPVNLDTLVTKEGVSMPMDDVTRKWLVGATDSLVDRGRGTVMAEVIKKYVTSHGADSRLTWMSVACGTALPAMKAAMHIGIDPKLLLVDADAGAMAETARLAQDIGFDINNVEAHRLNLMNPKSIARLRERLVQCDARPRVMDLVGIFEYVGEHVKIAPEHFLRAYYDILHPGGIMVFGQMRKDRPRPDFATGVVSWPALVMRSLDEDMQIIRDAGIDPQNVEIYLPTDGVYALPVIHKPEGR